MDPIEQIFFAREALERDQSEASTAGAGSPSGSPPPGNSWRRAFEQSYGPAQAGGASRSLPPSPGVQLAEAAPGSRWSGVPDDEETNLRGSPPLPSIHTQAPRASLRRNSLMATGGTLGRRNTADSLSRGPAEGTAGLPPRPVARQSDDVAARGPDGSLRTKAFAKASGPLELGDVRATPRGSLAGDLHAHAMQAMAAASAAAAPAPRSVLARRLSAGAPAQGFGTADSARQSEDNPGGSHLDFDDEVMADEAAAPSSPSPWPSAELCWTALPFIFMAVFALAGTFYVLVAPKQKWMYLEVWRWCYFGAGCIVAHWAAQLLVRLLYVAMEAEFFLLRNALYVAVSIRVSAARMVRSLLILPLFYLTFMEGEARPDEIQAAYDATAKVLICVLLACVVDLAKVVAAKIVAQHFHQQAHFQMMQAALKKEFFLHELSQPRPQSALAAATGTLSRATSHLGASPRGGSGEAPGEGPAGTQGRHKQPSRSFADLREPVGARGLRALRDFGEASTAATARRVAGAVQSGLQALQALPAKVSLTRTFATRYQPTALGPQKEPPWAVPVEEEDDPARQGGFATFSRREKETERDKENRPLLGVKLRGGTPHSPGGSLTGGRCLSQATEGSRALPDTASRKPSPLGHLHGKEGAELLQRLQLLERHMRENKLRVPFTDALGQAEASADEVSSKKEARRLAFYLFWNIRADFSQQHVLLKDLQYFLAGPEAAEALTLLDRDGDGKVSLADMRDAVVDVYQERKQLAFTLKDTRTVVGKLESIFAWILHILAIFLYLVIFEVNVNQVWLTASSIVLAFVFVFGNSIRNLYESVIFLFIVHPFDVGDALFIHEVYHTVEEIALNSCTLARWDGTRVWYPNQKLCLEPVHNISRSKERWEGFKILVDISAPPSLFEAVDTAVTAHFKKHATEFTGQHIVVARDAADPLKFTLAVFWEYAHPGKDLRRLSLGRHGLYLCITGAMTAAGAIYTLPPYPRWQWDRDGVATPAAPPLPGPGPPRPVGEGQAFAPPFLQPPALKL